MHRRLEDACRWSQPGFGRADLALASLGAARTGSSGVAGGATFAGDVLRRWAELLGHPATG